MSKAIDDLLNEHEAILSATQILDRLIAALEKSPVVDTKDIRDFIGFLKEFADKCHHGKEEDFLFPALVKAGLPEQGGPIGIMLAEHAQGRLLIHEMEESISNELDMVKLSGAARRYATLLRNHINKENGFLFPTTEKMLTEAQLAVLYQGFVEHEERVIGQGRHEDLHATLKSLQEKYPQ